MIFHTFIPGKPISQNKVGISRSGHRYLLPKPRAWMKKTKEIVAAQLREEGIKPPMFERGVPVALAVRAYFQLPKSHRRVRSPPSRVYKVTKPDTKNLVWLVEDTLSGLVFFDDNQVVRNITTKFTLGQEDTQEEGVEIACTDEALRRGLLPRQLSRRTSRRLAP